MSMRMQHRSQLGHGCLDNNFSLVWCKHNNNYSFDPEDPFSKRNIILPMKTPLLKKVMLMKTVERNTRVSVKEMLMNMSTET